MSDDRVKIPFDFEVDPQSVGRIEKALDNITKKEERLAKQFEQGNVSLKTATSQLSTLNSEKQELLSIERSINAESDRSNQKREEAIRQEQALTEESKRGLRAQQDRFDQISRDVSLAGDFQSNLGAVRGLSSAAGLGGVSQALDIGGESVALIEELPRLAAATAGLPGTIKASASALAVLTSEMAASVASSFAAAGGISGIAASSLAFIAGLGPFALAIGVAVIAITAIIAALTFWKRSSDNARKATEEQKEAEELTTDAVLDRLEVIGEEREALQELIAIREDSNQKTDDLTDKEKELIAEAEGLSIAMASGATAINDVIAAELALAEARSLAALEAGDDAATLVKLQQEIDEANTEALNSIIENLEQRKEVLLAERDALEETGDTSEEVQEKIIALNDSLGDVNEQLEQATLGASIAAAAERTLTAERETTAKEAERLAEKESQAAAKRITQQAAQTRSAAQAAAKSARSAATAAAKKAQRASESVAKKAQSTAQTAAKKRSDALTKINESLIKLQEKFNKDTANAFRKAKRTEAGATRNANKSRIDLLKDLSRQEEDLIASGDIFAIADIREKASDDLADLRTDFDFDAGERKIQRRNEATDRLREAQATRLKLRQSGLAQFNDLAQQTRGVRTQWRGMLTGLGNDLASFSRAVTGRAGNVAGRTSGITRLSGNTNVGVNVNIDGAPMRALVQQEIRAIA